MRSFLFFLICTLTLPALADDVGVSLRQRGHQYEVEISNASHDIIRINHDMSLAPVLGQLQFKIYRGAEELQMQGDINGDLSTDKSYVSLLPGQYFGGVFDADHVQAMYGMSAGCYAMEVVYFDRDAPKFGGFGQKVTSNRLKVCVP